MIYPLRPGCPRVYRRAPGRWAFECHCQPYSRAAAMRTSQPNHDTQQHALRAALAHVRAWHIDPLEVAFNRPAYGRTADAQPSTEPPQSTRTHLDKES